MFTNKNRGIAVTQTNVFIYQFTICFGPGRQSSNDSGENTQMVMDYT
jgi:hypothetical protein